MPHEALPLQARLCTGSWCSSLLCFKALLIFACWVYKTLHIAAHFLHSNHKTKRLLQIYSWKGAGWDEAPKWVGSFSGAIKIACRGPEIQQDSGSQGKWQGAQIFYLAKCRTFVNKIFLMACVVWLIFLHCAFIFSPFIVQICSSYKTDFKKLTGFGLQPSIAPKNSSLTHMHAYGRTQKSASVHAAPNQMVGRKTCSDACPSLHWQKKTGGLKQVTLPSQWILSSWLEEAD